MLNALKAQGTTADMVQIGNEINGGMLWPDGHTATTGRNLAGLLNAGYDAVKAVDPLDEGGAAPGQGRRQLAGTAGGSTAPPPTA